MLESINAAESPATGRIAQTDTPAWEGRETARRASATPPGNCELCVPVVRVIEDGYFLTVSEASHEVDCPNHPKHTQLLKESAWSTQSSA